MNLKITTSLLVAAGLLVLNGSVLACPGGKCGSKGPMLKEELGLSDQQADKVREIMKEGRKDESCEETAKGPEKRECFKAKRDKMQKQLSGVLTVDQMEKFKQLRKEKMPNHRKGHHEEA